MPEPQDTPAEAKRHPTPENKPPGRTRRDFLGSGGRKALYLTPIILTLTARQAKAASGMSGASG